MKLISPKDSASAQLDASNGREVNLHAHFLLYDPAGAPGKRQIRLAGRGFTVRLPAKMVDRAIRAMKRAITALLLLAMPLCAGDLYKQSVVVLMTAHSADYLSSLNAKGPVNGIYELNPLARRADGSFSPVKGLTVKAGIVGGALLLERFLLRRKSGGASRALLTRLHFAAAAGVGSVAVRNWRLSR